MAEHTTSTTSNPSNLPAAFWPASHYLAKAERSRRTAARQADPRLAAVYIKSAEAMEHMASQQAARGFV